MISANLLAIFYLISGILFILALRGLSSPETSRQGNLFGIIGMAIAITVTFLSIDNFSSGFLYVILFLLFLMPLSLPILKCSPLILSLNLLFKLNDLYIRYDKYICQI